MIPAYWIPSAIRSLQNAVADAAKSVATHVTQSEGPKPEDSWALPREQWRSDELERANRSRVAMRQLEEALDQLDAYGEQAAQQDVVVAAEARGVRVALAGVLSEASQALLRDYDGVLTDERLGELTRMLGSVQWSTSRARSATRRRSTSRKPSA